MKDELIESILCLHLKEKNYAKIKEIVDSLPRQRKRKDMLLYLYDLCLEEEDVDAALEIANFLSEPDRTKTLNELFLYCVDEEDLENAKKLLEFLPESKRIEFSKLL